MVRMRWIDGYGGFQVEVAPYKGRGQALSTSCGCGARDLTTTSTPVGTSMMEGRSHLLCLGMNFHSFVS